MSELFKENEAVKDEIWFLETIKWAKDRYHNLPGHEARLRRTWRKYFQEEPAFSLEEILPQDLGPGLIKVRLAYSQKSHEVTHSPYVFPVVANAELVQSDLYYGEKFMDRSRLSQLKAASQADEIIIVQDGQITDCSLANLVFVDRKGGFFTSERPLLPGVKREALLAEGRIEKKPIRPRDLDEYERVFLINAMIDLADGVGFEVA
ncbi:MAG: aminotransferase class IV, partial [Deltaproteobacteria bacterium]|nr:aminotransferase class IV [Deltaproteobacteria bacterium]